MLKSMTGFGRGESSLEDGSVVVEVKSLNHRYLDVSCKVPKRFSSLENQMRKAILDRFSRGRFEISIQYDFVRKGSQGFQLNLPLAQEYYSILKELKDRLRLDDDISLGLLAGVKDIILVKEVESDQEGKEEEKAFYEAFSHALGSLERMRMAEGETLCRDFLEKLGKVNRMVNDIEGMSTQVLIKYRDRLINRVKELSGSIEVDAGRLNQEIAFLAERSDINEELVRMASHLEQFDAMTKINEPVGRRLDFLLQEINREINTVASKANDANISQKVVQVKGELEKMREQVQNIE